MINGLFIKNNIYNSIQLSAIPLLGRQKFTVDTKLMLPSAVR